MPGYLGSALEPFVGVLGDTGRRRALLLVGGVMFALSAFLTAISTGFWLLLVALALGNPATSAFVSLAQASLVDLEPHARERNMAWWTLAGSVGIVAGPLLLAGAIVLGGGWREVSGALALAALALTLAARRAPIRSSAEGRPVLRSLVDALSASQASMLSRPDSHLESGRAPASPATHFSCSCSGAFRALSTCGSAQLRCSSPIRPFCSCRR